ncbi:MAG TPA: polysaccharide biosynthesis tyrosine autokinase [Stellaceae bacterium]|nr:polysaccharide biosynthesis tyrosine autokinase [Stellaceae bacterium]
MAVEIIRQDDVDRWRITRGSSRELVESMPIPLSRTAVASQGVSAFDIFASIWRRRRLIALIVVPILLATFVGAELLPRRYTAEGAIVIASRKYMIPELESISTPTGDIDIVRSEMAVLRSRTLLRGVAKKLHLDTVPEFNSRLRPVTWYQRLDPRPYIDAFFEPKGGQPIDESERVDSEVEYTLDQNLGISNDSRDYVITLDYRSKNPRLSAQIVNTLMADYINQYIESKVTATISANASLNARAEDLRKEVADADAKVKAYANKSGFLQTRLGTVSSQQLNDLNTQLATARADRAAAEARYAQAVQLQHTGASTASDSEVLASPLIQRLREKEADLLRQQADASTRLGPLHPERRGIEQQLSDIRRNISGEIGKVVQSLKGNVDVARARESSLQQRVTQLQGTALNSADSQQEYERLQADSDGKRKVYNEFLLRVAQTAKPDDKQQADARIISNAVPPTGPSFPHVFQLTLIAGVIATLGSAASVLLSDQIDHGFESLGEVRTGTGLLGFGAVPSIRRRGRRATWQRYVLDHPYSSYAETIRGFRARLHAASRFRPAKVILMTSAQAGEGKTSIALAFARLTAQDGQRVLLIDCDLRRPALGKILALPTADDYSDVLAGHVSWRDNVRVDQISGLHYLVTARPPRNVSQILETKGIEQTLREAAAEYDFVVIDSPPIMRVTDALLLARYVDIVALVVWWRHTRRRLVEEALRRLDTHTDKLCGVILNKVATAHASDDGYSGYGA